MDSCPVRAEQVLEGHGRPLRTTLSRPSDWAKYEIARDVALHFGPEDHSCAEKLNKNNNQVGRETLQLFKSGQRPDGKGPVGRGSDAGCGPPRSGRSVRPTPLPFVGGCRLSEFSSKLPDSTLEVGRLTPCRTGPALGAAPSQA